jgi:DNA-binding NtrC family response regulator
MSVLRPSVGLEQIAETILDAALNLFGVPRGALLLGQTGPTSFDPIVAMRVSREDLSIAEKLCGMIRIEGADDMPLAVEDARSDPRLGPAATTLTAPMRSMVWVPLVTTSGYFGALYLDSPSPGAFQERVLPLARLVGATAAAALESAQIHEELVRENAHLRRESGPMAQPFGSLIGSSSAMEILRRQASIAANTERPLIILGEPGSGRRLLARAIHDASIRAGRPFVAGDSSVVRPRLLKELLFGRAAGAGMGEPGLIRLADRGTLYITNAQHLGGSLGSALALMAESGIFRPNGTRRDARVDVRLILASDGEWADKVKEPTRRSRNRFPRNDWFRLDIPPLRERIEDIPDLVVHFERTFSGWRGKRRRVTFSPEALGALQMEAWPCNVRELRQVVQRAILFSTKSVLDASQIRRCMNLRPETEEKDWGPRRGTSPSLSDWEAAAVRHALLIAEGNKSGAARLLQIHRNTLDRKLRRLEEQSLRPSGTP